MKTIAFIYWTAAAVPATVGLKRGNGMLLKGAGLVFFASLSIFVATGTAISAVEPGWELVRKDADLTLYEREVPGSDVVAFKGDGVLEAPLDRVAAVLLDSHRAPEWVNSLKEARVLRMIGPLEYIEYNHIGTPFVMKDRDFVTHVKIRINDSDRTMAISYQSIDDPSAPQTDYVRGKVISSTFFLAAVDGGAHTRLLAEIQADPMGSVPKWIVNFFQKSWPRDTFHGIQAQLRKRDLGTPEHFEGVVARLRAAFNAPGTDTAHR